MTKAERDTLSKADLKKADWVIRGPMTASECFHCGNKIDQELRDAIIAVYCRDPCHPKPINQKKD